MPYKYSSNEPPTTVLTQLLVKQWIFSQNYRFWAHYAKVKKNQQYPNDLNCKNDLWERQHEHNG